MDHFISSDQLMKTVEAIALGKTKASLFILSTWPGSELPQRWGSFFSRKFTIQEQRKSWAAIRWIYSFPLPTEWREKSLRWSDRLHLFQRSPAGAVFMLNNQNTFQNAGQHGFFYYQSIGNQSSTFLVILLTIILLVALMKSEERYRSLIESIHQVWI